MNTHGTEEARVSGEIAAVFLSFAGLTEDPFRIPPDARYLYLSEQHGTARTYLESSVVANDGCVVITGEAGSGKTILIDDFLSNLGPETIAIRIHQTQVSPVDFLQCMLVELGVPPFRNRKAELLSIVNSFLVRNYAAGRRVVLAVDEAQHLSLQVLEEIRLLSEIDSGGTGMLSIILAGQPGFRETLYSPQLEQLAQRAPLHVHLHPLDRAETEGYVKHRLAIAGDAGGETFRPGAFDLIYDYAGGVPRRINCLCRASMLCAYAENLSVVSADEVSEAIEELRHAHSSEAGQIEQIEQIEPPADIERARADRQPPERPAAADGITVLAADVEHREMSTEEPDQSASANGSGLEADVTALSEAVNALKRELCKATAERQEATRELERARAENARLETESRSRTASIRRDEPRARIGPGRLGMGIEPVDGREREGNQQHETRLLIALDDGSQSLELPIDKPRLSLGSSPDNDVQVSSVYTSLHHAQLISNGKQSILNDLDSTNGTYVNSKRVRRHALRDGDLITIGKHRFRYVQQCRQASESRQELSASGPEQ